MYRLGLPGCITLGIRMTTRGPASERIHNAEYEIDEAFAQNSLANLPFAQSAWTLLSVAEDHHFKIAVASPPEAPQAAIYVDGLMNSLTYPLRVCHERSSKGVCQFKRELVDDHYALADEWLDRAEDYAHFCTIFPMFHAKEIDLEIRGNQIVPTDWSAIDMSYEVYDRFVAKRDPQHEVGLDPNPFQLELRANMRVTGGMYSVRFTQKLMSQIAAAFTDQLAHRHSLPGNWKFQYFSLGEYRAVIVCLQSLAYAWFAARQLAAMDGATAIAYASSVWTPAKGLLVITIARQTKLPKAVVGHVLRYLTFGEMGIRTPDIAIQPLVDLTNGQYAVSPFVFTHINAERNLCVLLNQIPEDRRIYSQLVDEKEAQARLEVIASLAGLGLEFEHGQLADTDVDLAIVDRVAKVCLCIEIKWFIEPAEVREILARSEELRKGVKQSLKIATLFAGKDSRLLGLLQIDDSFDFQTMVGSVNFIGSHRVQHAEVPIAKLWHVASALRSLGSLGALVDWLRNRRYLPRKEEDYKISDVSIQSGNWKSRWYGITYA